MRRTSASYPGYRWAAPLIFAVLVLSAAVTTKNDADANLARSGVQSSSARLSSRAAVVNDSSVRSPQASQARLLAAYGKLPLSFELNQGQTDPRVKFLSRGSGYSLFLTSDGAVLTLRKSGPRPQTVSRDAAHQFPIGPLQRAIFRASGAAKHTPSGAAEVFRMRLVGANAMAKVTGLEKLPGKSNYFIGNDSKKWRTNVPNYAKVKYANVYPGVDLVYYGNQRQLEYDFVVRPGADPHLIKLAIRSSAATLSSAVQRIDRNGDLVVRMRWGEVRLHKPVVYQPATDAAEFTGNAGHKNANRRFLDAKYVITSGHASFEIAGYDNTKPLVIDPTLAYSTYLGGSGL
jgi:hypothetical protein